MSGLTSLKPLFRFAAHELIDMMRAGREHRSLGGHTCVYPYGVVRYPTSTTLARLAPHIKTGCPPTCADIYCSRPWLRYGAVMISIIQMLHSRVRFTQQGSRRQPIKSRTQGRIMTFTRHRARGWRWGSRRQRAHRASRRAAHRPPPPPPRAARFAPRSQRPRAELGRA